MIGPHYQRLAEAENRFTSKQILQRMTSKSNNPLYNIIDKLKHQFSQYDTVYSQELINHQITSVDRLLSYDGKLGPILSALQKQNNLLRRQVSVLQAQLAKSVEMWELILKENNEQKDIILKKNADIKKIIDTIAINESENVTDLQEKVTMLQQENSILIRHLDEVKQQHESYVYKFEAKQQQIFSWKKKWQQTKKHLAESLSRQQDISRKLSLSEDNLYLQNQAVYNLENEIQTLKFHNNELKNQILLFKDEPSSANLDVYKRKLETEYAPIIEEHKALKKQRIQLLRTGEKAKLDKQAIQQKMMDIQRRYNKAINDLQLTSSLLNEQKQKNAVIISTINKLESKIDQLKQQNNKLELNLNSANNYAVTKERMLHQQIDDIRRQLDAKSIDTERRLQQLRDKTKALMQAKDIEMNSLNQTNIELRRLLERRHQ